MTDFKIDQGKEWLATLSGIDCSYGNKWNKPSDGHDSVTKVWYFDVQWSDCPVEVEEQVIKAWQDYDLGNDRYIFKCKLDEELFNDYPAIYFWLEHKGVQKGEKVIVHWWW